MLMWHHGHCDAAASGTLAGLPCPEGPQAQRGWEASPDCAPEGPRAAEAHVGSAVQGDTMDTDPDHSLSLQ